jgi:hypothetical protein
MGGESNLYTGSAYEAPAPVHHAAPMPVPTRSYEPPPPVPTSHYEPPTAAPAPVPTPAPSVTPTVSPATNAKPINDQLNKLLLLKEKRSQKRKDLVSSRRSQRRLLPKWLLEVLLSLNTRVTSVGIWRMVLIFVIFLQNGRNSSKLLVSKRAISKMLILES